MSTPAPAKFPAGVSMLLNALKINPAEIMDVAGNLKKTVQEIADKLDAIEKKQDQILALLAPESNNGKH